MQAKEIVKYLKPGRQTVILTGDFNAEPGTAEIQFLEKHFRTLNDPDSHTFPVGEPVKTIDFVMVSSDARSEATEARVNTGVVYSDHYPVTAIVKLAPDELVRR